MTDWQPGDHGMCVDASSNEEGQLPHLTEGVNYRIEKVLHPGDITDVNGRGCYRADILTLMVDSKLYRATRFRKVRPPQSVKPREKELVDA